VWNVTVDAWSDGTIIYAQVNERKACVCVCVCVCVCACMGGGGGGK